MFTKYISEVKSNHGIKSDNIFNLLWPLGFSSSQVNSFTLDLLDSYGSKRGYIAHTGENVNKKVLNYKSEKKDVEQLKMEIAKIDMQFEINNYLDPKIDVNIIESILY